VASRHLLPILNQPVYRRLFGDLEPQYPVAARLNRRGFVVGCHVGLTLEDMDHTSQVLHRYFLDA
jgi:dTDP-4-amino-4,6-dideoxygalactose transaminase